MLSELLDFPVPPASSEPLVFPVPPASSEPLVFPVPPASSEPLGFPVLPVLPGLPGLSDFPELPDLLLPASGHCHPWAVLSDHPQSKDPVHPELLLQEFLLLLPEWSRPEHMPEALFRWQERHLPEKPRFLHQAR